MKRLALIITAALVSANVASAADSRITEVCGINHRNELVSFDDASANPAGHYIASLKVQLYRGDPRIIATNDDTFHLCTRSAATPDMEATRAILMMNERTVRYLFVPMERGPLLPAPDISG